MTMPALFAVTPNPALDLTVTLSQLKDNATHRVPAIRRRLGGKGINVASVAAEQGFDAVALGPVSSLSLSEYGQHISTGTGEPLPDQLRQAFTDTPTPLRSTLTVHENERVSTSIINEAGAPHPPQVFDTMLATLGEELTDHPGSAVTLSGSFPPGAPTDLVSRLAQLCRATDTTLVVDSYGDPLLQACDHNATVVTPNAEELIATTGCTDVNQGARQLLQRGAQMVVVTLGGEGIHAATSKSDSSLHARLRTPLQGNPTGAGDALTAALATAFVGGQGLNELSLRDVLARAVSWSAAAVLNPTAGTLNAGDTDWTQFMSSVQVS